MEDNPIYKPSTRTGIVYKYRNWKQRNHKNVLLKNILWLSKPSDFNDPFDCMLFADYSRFTKEEILQQISDSILVEFPQKYYDPDFRMEIAKLIYQENAPT